MPKLTSGQRRYIRRRLRAAAPTGSPVDDELNIVPFLDIVVNLIVFLLMVTTASLAAGQLPIEVPHGDTPTPTSSLPQQVTFAITDGATLVSLNRGVLPPECVSIPGVAGAPDALGLRRCAQVMFAAAPNALVVLTADPNLEHGHLVRSMDAIRGTTLQPLYTSIHLAAGVR